MRLEILCAYLRFPRFFLRPVFRGSRPEDLFAAARCFALHLRHRAGAVKCLAEACYLRDLPGIPAETLEGLPGLALSL